MKVYMIGPTYPYRGGISHYTTLLYRTFKKYHDVVLCAVKRQYPMWLYPGQTDKDSSQVKLEEPDVRYLLDSMNPISWIRIVFHIKKHNPQMVILPWWVSFWTLPYWVICTGIKFLRSVKILFVCHNVVEHESSRFGQFCTKLVLRKGDYFIVHSKEVKESLLYLVPNANVRQKSHPNYQFFKIDGINPEEERKKIGFTRDHIVLLFFGFIRKYKGVPYLLEAVGKLAKEYPHIRLLLAGEAWHEEEARIREKIREYGLESIVIRKNEYIPNEDVEKYYAAADIAMFPYSTATASGALQIAYAFQKPVIASALSCFMEIVQDGRTGYLIPPENPGAIVDAVKKFLLKGKLNTDRYEEMRKNISELNKDYSWDGMVEEITGFVE
ncbi:glycosyltransferase [candidate division KSB1 bacterium]|nr:glycosyltransferase [candidate division KSB1 bacterium]